jgi:DNA-binding XRE family transcriptional regulator
MTKIVNDYTWVLDDVELAIDFRGWRERNHFTQEQVSEWMQWESTSPVSAIENGKYAESLKLRDFLKLCHLMDVSPSLYFRIQLVGA